MPGFIRGTAPHDDDLHEGPAKATLAGGNVFTGPEANTFFGPVGFTGDVGFYGATPAGTGAPISNPSGGITTDSQARTAINSILSRLRDLGLIE